MGKAGACWPGPALRPPLAARRADGCPYVRRRAVAALMTAASRGEGGPASLALLPSITPCLVIACGSRANNTLVSPRNHRRVVVTGLGVVSCLGHDHASFYDALLEGKSGACARAPSWLARGLQTRLDV